MRSCADGTSQMTDEDRACRQCGGTIDGGERQYEINGTSVWLHDQCRRFFIQSSNAGRTVVTHDRISNAVGSWWS